MGKTNKSKFINKHGVSQFVLYSMKGQQLNDREVYTINNHAVDGLLQFGVVKKGSSFELIYNLVGLVTLQDYLMNPLNRESFARILQNILDVFKAMQNAFFSPHSLLMDFEHVMVNPATQKLAFIYVPIQNYNSGCELRDFLLDIIQAGRFVKEEDSNYVKEYIRILNNGINFSVFELEEYIKGLASESGYRVEKTVTCFKCGTQLNTGNNFCPVCGAKVTTCGEINSTVYDPLAQSAPKEIAEQVSVAEIPRQTHVSETQGLSSKMLESDDGGTTLLGMYETMYETEKYLVREKTGERIQITKDVFRVGKSVNQCDYAVTDNSMVSRTHAEIVKTENGYVIVDLKSTNKTYVDNVEVHEQKEIQSGCKIKLANEVFTFYVE